MDSSSFFVACESGDLQTVKKSIAFLQSINQKNDRGWSGLIMAAFNGHKHVVEYLIDNGADVNDCNKNGTTVFMYAKDSVLTTNDFSLLDLLIARGADINRKDNKGLTVLDYIKLNSYDKLIPYMLANGAK